MELTPEIIRCKQKLKPGKYLDDRLLTEVAYKQFWLGHSENEQQQILDRINNEYKPSRARSIIAFDIRGLLAQNYGMSTSPILEALLLVMGCSSEELWREYSQKDIDNYYYSL
jgi:hypothetical protein